MTDDSLGQIVVKDIIPNSLAQKSGIMAGDIVNKYNGEVLTEVSDLIYLLDKEKRIIAKQLTIEQFDDIIQVKSKKPPTK
jgi:S1-C subfamily serine protease